MTCLAVVLAACVVDDKELGDDAASDTGEGTEDSTGTDTTGTGTEDTTGTDTAGTGTEDTTGTDTTGEDGEVECTLVAGDHTEAACEGGACPVVTDVELVCDDSDFSDPGLRVAVDDAQAYLVTASSNAAIWLSASGGQGEVDLELPETLNRQPILLAQDASGAIRLAADTTQFDGGNYTGGLEFFYREGGQWVGEEVFDLPNKYVRTTDFSIASDGTAHLWFEDDPPESYEHAWRTAPGVWSLEDFDPGTPGNWNRMSLDPEDLPLAWHLVDQGNSWQLLSQGGGEDIEIGGPIVSFFPSGYEPIEPPLPASQVETPARVALVQHQDALRVAWSTDGPMDYTETEAPETPLTQFNCMPGDPYIDCGPDCHEVIDGLGDESFAGAQTSDGRLWVAWIEDHHDLVLSYTQDCGEGENRGECYCVSEAVQDDSTATLHLASVDYDQQTLTERMTMPIPLPQRTNLFVGRRVIEAQAYEDQLVIGLRLRGEQEELGARKLRLLQVDTGSL